MKGKDKFMERFTVSLDDFIKYLIKKWIIVAGVMLLGIVSFVLSALLLGEKIIIPPSDKYADLKAEEERFEAYIENAPFMKMDPTNIHERIIYLSNITERDSLKNYIESGKVWNDFEDDTFKKYFFDQVTWYDSATQSAEIKIQYYEEADCKKIAEYLLNQILKYDNSLSALLGDAYISNDKEVADEQLWCINRLDDIRGQLEHTAAGYVIETSLPAAAVVGAIAGIFIAAACLFIAFLHDTKRENCR